MKNSIKVSVNLSESDVELLKEAANFTDTTMSDIIRHALSLERLAQKIRSEGGRMLIEKDGKYHEIIL